MANHTTDARPEGAAESDRPIELGEWHARLLDRSYAFDADRRVELAADLASLRSSNGLVAWRRRLLDLSYVLDADRRAALAAALTSDHVHQQYYVIADRDKGDEPDFDDVRTHTDRVTVEHYGQPTERIVRIERPLPRKVMIHELVGVPLPPRDEHASRTDDEPEEVRQAQPTSSAEPIACPHWEPGQIKMRNGCTACAVAAELQSIDNMAPGTTFETQLLGGTQWYRVRVPTFGTQFYIVDSERYVDRLSIDTLTIRDVTPTTDA